MEAKQAPLNGVNLHDQKKTRFYGVKSMKGKGANED